jgi:flagellar protein FliJ
MKKYEFRLEAVLKLRRLKEENCRIELGQLLMQMKKIEDQISHDRAQQSTYQDIQESSLKQGVTAGQLQAFPMLLAAKDTNILYMLKEKEKQERLIQEKRQELATLKGELKVMENLKEKNYNEFKKALGKENDQKVEEQTQNWLAHRQKASP